MRKINQSSRFDDKNVFREKNFQISAVRMGVCAYMDASAMWVPENLFVYKAQLCGCHCKRISITSQTFTFVI